jgi:hypothetical protein
MQRDVVLDYLTEICKAQGLVTLTI